jgi:hypothetical protein
MVGKMAKIRIRLTAGAMKKVPAWRSTHSRHRSEDERPAGEAPGWLVLV